MDASRTLLFSLQDHAWDEELCDLFGVPVECLPEPVPTAQVLGETREFGGRVPVAPLTERFRASGS